MGRFWHCWFKSLWIPWKILQDFLAKYGRPWQPKQFLSIVWKDFPLILRLANKPSNCSILSMMSLAIPHIEHTCFQTVLEKGQLKNRWVGVSFSWWHREQIEEERRPQFMSLSFSSQPSFDGHPKDKSMSWNAIRKPEKVLPMNNWRGWGSNVIPGSWIVHRSRVQVHWMLSFFWAARKKEECNFAHPH